MGSVTEQAGQAVATAAVASLAQQATGSRSVPVSPRAAEGQKLTTVTVSGRFSGDNYYEADLMFSITLESSVFKGEVPDAVLAVDDNPFASS